ncbi:hypothetical protein LPJ77_002425 [Coemansia sp. RSA 2523]|nr:hypothetical protein LPJ58_004299 [Coemansia sp. RSA 1591]KAJ1757935.1 hypothetical protein LPJ69_004243 [Coemansia sp. RSA 1752]KAJ1778049.1 hypothetical protein LPJ54_001974 [Coemansia sp. RSA 1824]KAJ1783216.1 hypothetical protein LPJ62_005131 [Coemansia sp. RSA 2167]KAJ1784842.1 hypothetical protein LPJ67_004176 [Coemansia sp. RSA 1938]KAJ1808320.1 hypothetical protein LPJ77_002425 [Coemansia sp. RSA 2523]KAJ2128777.1 hypothetical protein GGF48_002715 [Coemansia sp. RSA 921]KAJ2134131
MTSASTIERRHMQLRKQQAGKRSLSSLSIDTQFVIAHTDFESQYKGILSIRRGDILRIESGSDMEQKWWRGTIVKSYYGSKGYGYFFPVLTEEYDFMDSRIASRIPMALMKLNGQHRNSRRNR